MERLRLTQQQLYDAIVKLPRAIDYEGCYFRVPIMEELSPVMDFSVTHSFREIVFEKSPSGKE